MEISIIIPMYNASKYVEACINSIKSQTYMEWECIIIDDCSTDNSFDIVKNLTESDERFVLVKKEINSGCSDSRYIGLEMAKGNWIAFVDADDVIHEDYILRLFELIDKGKNIDVVCCKSMNMGAKKNIFGYKQDKIRVLSGKEALGKLYSNSVEGLNTMWGKLIRKESLYTYDYPQNKEVCPKCYFEDGLVTPILYSTINELVISEDVLYSYRYSPESLSHSISKESGIYSLEMIISSNIVRDYLISKGYDEYASWGIEGKMLLIMRAFYSLQDDLKHKKILSDMFKQSLPYWRICKNRKKMVVLNVFLFGLNKSLWCKTIGNIYFKLLYSGIKKR